MKKPITPAASAAIVVPGAVEEALQDVGASFERLGLTAGIAALTAMMEEDAAKLCGARYQREDSKTAFRWGKTKGKLGFHGGGIGIERPRVRSRDGKEMPLPAGRRPYPVISPASG